MHFPDFIKNLPALDVPVPDDALTTRAIRSERGLAVIFTARKGLELPPHSHKGQWVTVLEGELHLTTCGATRVYRVGESYTIPSGTEHAAHLPAGSVVLDIFEEPDRYPLRDG